MHSAQQVKENGKEHWYKLRAGDENKQKRQTQARYRTNTRFLGSDKSTDVQHHMV
jgi:hypothetical protein